jgi:hypothetical protein
MLILNEHALFVQRPKSFVPTPTFGFIIVYALHSLMPSKLEEYSATVL